MSGSLHAWYSLRDLESLADRGVTLSGELDIGRLTRLRGGELSVLIAVSWLASEVEYRADVELVCQRCLEPFRQELEENVNVVIADSDSLPTTVPTGFEPFELEDGRLQPVQLIEDEVIVAIPLVPKHARVEDCGSLARQIAGHGERP